MDAIGIFDQQLAALVLVGIGEEQCGRYIDANLVAGGRNQAHRIVDVIAEILAAIVAIEERRIDLRRQDSTDEKRIALQRRQDQFAKLTRCRRMLWQLQIVLDLAALIASRCAAIYPVGGIQHRAAVAHLFDSQNIRDRKKHAISPLYVCRIKHAFMHEREGIHSIQD